MSYSRWINKFEVKPGSWVYVPSEKAIDTGKAIKCDLDKKWNPPLNYYHLMPGGHVKAIKQHINNKIFVHLDIKHFFNSINKSRVTRNLKKFYRYEKAREIAIESTVKIKKEGSPIFVLPFGFVQSPLLSSLCLFHSALGQQIEKIRKTMNYVKISIYMDDIIVSTKHQALCEKILNMIKAAAEKSKFYLNPEKEEGPSDKVTAFNIDLRHERINVEYNRLIEFAEAYNYATNEFQQVGIENYIKSVNPNQTKSLLKVVK